MAVTKQERPQTETTVVADRHRQDFWTKNSRLLLGIGGAILLLAGGWFGYKKLIEEPKERKATEAIFRAEEYYRMDSLNLALNGDNRGGIGLEKIISEYGGTSAGNRARFMAGSIYLRQGNFAKAEDHLEDFETDSKLIQARAYKLLGDAYAEQKKNEDALEAYTKAARHFEKDATSAAEYLFIAAYFADRVMKDREEAIELFKELKKKYPNTRQGFEADKYLAQAGVYN